MDSKPASAYFHKFSTGEISVAAMARVDQERAKLAAEVQENILPYAIGKGQVRPGFERLGAPHSDNRAELIPFVRSVDDVAMLELTDLALRIWVDDGATLLERSAVSSTITNGDFSSGTGWTITATGGASGSISGGVLEMVAPARGGLVTVARSVSTSSATLEHAVRIVVTRNFVGFRIGSTSGEDDVLASTTLGAGEHSLAFRPTTATYYVEFFSNSGLTAVVDQVQIESAGPVVLPTPWSTAQLREVQLDQSQDVMFCAHNSSGSRKIERRAERSWSVVEYRADDGPFVPAKTADVTLKVADVRGETTLTADQPFFNGNHVGALFRLTHGDMDTSWELGAENTYTDAWRVYGIGTDTNFSVVTTGTFVGTLQIQRSYTGPTSGFQNVGVTITTATTTAYVPGSSYDNVEHWYRVGFQSGGYTSGSVTVAVSDAGSTGSGICRVTAVTNSKNCDVDMIEPAFGTTTTDDWLEGQWSAVRGYPSAVRFYDGRLWFAGKDKVWGSESDAYYAFNLDTEGSAGSVQRNIATGASVAEVRWMLPLQRLIVGTSSSVVSMRSNGDDGIITPTNLTIKDAATQGAAPRRPAKLDSRGVYIHRDRTRLWEIVYDFESNDYQAQELTKLNEDIGLPGFEGLAIQRAPETYLWVPRSDGQIALMLYDVREKVAAWTRVVTAGLVESVCVLPQATGPDRVFICVRREIGGVTSRHIERMALHTEAQGGTTNYMADSYQVFAGPVTSVTVPHLANATNLVAWGVNADGVATPLRHLTANASGVITLGGGTYTNLCVGLTYVWRYKSAKLAFGAGEAGSILEPKRIGQVGLLLQNTHRLAVTYGSSFDKLYPMRAVENGKVVADTDVYSVYDEVTMPFGARNWDTDERIHMRGSAPYPATLLGLLIKMDVGESSGT